jgi:hypothetical protein
LLDQTLGEQLREPPDELFRIATVDGVTGPALAVAGVAVQGGRPSK